MKNAQLILLYIFCVLVSSTFAQKEISKPFGETEQRFLKVDLTASKSKLDIFRALLIAGNIAGGIELSRNEDRYSKFEIDGTQIFSIGDGLNLINKAEIKYATGEINGVVNISPESSYDIMNLRIPYFSAEEEFPWDLGKKMAQTREFQSYLSRHNLVDKIRVNSSQSGILIIQLIGRPNPRQKISLKMENATVREILNEIVRKSKDRVWTYQEYDLIVNGVTFHLYKLEI